MEATASLIELSVAATWADLQKLCQVMWVGVEAAR